MLNRDNFLIRRIDRVYPCVVNSGRPRCAFVSDFSKNKKQPRPNTDLFVVFRFQDELWQFVVNDLSGKDRTNFYFGHLCNGIADFASSQLTVLIQESRRRADSYLYRGTFAEILHPQLNLWRGSIDAGDLRLKWTNPGSVARFCVGARKPICVVQLTRLISREGGVDDDYNESRDFYEKAWFSICLVSKTLTKILITLATSVTTVFCAACGLFIIEDEVPRQPDRDTAWRTFWLGLAIIGCAQGFALLTIYLGASWT